MSDISLVALPYFQSYGTESQNGLLFHSSTSLSNEISYPIHSSTHQQTSQWISDTQMQPYQSIPRQFEQYQSTSSFPQAQESFQYYNHQLSNSDNQQAQQYQQPQQYYHSPPSHQLPILPPPPIYQAPPAIIQEEILQDYGARKPFISKLGYLLRNPDLFGDVIQWNEAGDTFIFAPSPRFYNEVLVEIFAHSSVSAFTRQLNTYAFRHLSSVQLAEAFTHSPDKITPVRELSSWTHPNFHRDFPLLANRMLPTPSRARSAHHILKHTMLLERGTSVLPRRSSVASASTSTAILPLAVKKQKAARKSKAVSAVEAQAVAVESE